ncbi:MAG: 2-hydroxyglutaryl-CoA dehydratase [Deltaproteobacteria bacterium]|nr:2-hydroxyglutaryl-CoA dehydratase [Deltaproteobacteria bacterium]
METYLGIDVGSVTTKLAVLDEHDELVDCVYLLTQGRPIDMIQEGLREIRKQLPADCDICGVATTGSARYLAGVIVGADLVKNEITAHAVAVIDYVPDVRTIIEIGGQDSKIIIMREHVVVDFAMNTVCAAGTGSFLDQQAARLGISIEEFGDRALRSHNRVRIAGRCTVFAESDMIHKQQLGYQVEDIIAGLCDSLVKNYLNNVSRGKEILPPVVFQGGVAANKGIGQALERELGLEVIIPPHFDLMGAIGAAKLARRAGPLKSLFKGLEVAQWHFSTRSFECDGCGNTCDVMELIAEGKAVARWGDTCGKHSDAFGETHGER